MNRIARIATAGVSAAATDAIGRPTTAKTTGHVGRPTTASG